MTLQDLKHELEAYILINEVYIDGEEHIRNVASLTFECKYARILYNYGIEVLLTVMEVLESNQIYEQCSVIKQVIENINKLEGTKFPTKYKNHE